MTPNVRSQVGLEAEVEVGARRVYVRGWLAASLRRIAQSKQSTLGGIMLTMLVTLALLAPYIAPYDPIKIYPREALLSPSQEHPFGTDHLGRDILSRVVYGARISLWVGGISVVISSTIGTLLGILSGYYGGWLDIIVQAIMDIMLAFPGILLALSVVAVLGTGLVNVMIAVGISWIPTYARVVRGSTLSARENVYVEAARTIGCSNFRVMWHHILPNVMAPVLVLCTLGIAHTILVSAAFSFLGLGAQPPTPEWGKIMADGRNYLARAWWITTFPGLAIVVTILSFNFLGDGLRDVLDPRLRV